MDSETADALFEALADRQRRRLLFVLLEEEARNEGVTIPGDIQFEDTPHLTVELRMQHTHLPKLQQMDLIKWDKSQQVAPGSRFEDVRPALERIQPHCDDAPATNIG